MATEFVLLYSECAPEEKKALALASSFLSTYTELCHRCQKATPLQEELLGRDLFLLGTCEDNPYIQRLCADGHLSPCDKEEGFTVKFMESPYAEGRYLLIVAAKADPKGVLYGTVELFYNLLPDKKNRHDHCPYFHSLFQKHLPAPFEVSSAPACPHRGLWTWGHVIFDYRRYVDRMVSMKMNSLVIWNDHPPVNLEEVIHYAHNCGIRVYAGYAWGWDNKTVELTPEYLRTLRGEIVKEYQKNYARYPLDGIYFQSFTETHKEELNGMDIAREVTALVNDVAALLWQDDPALKLLFGLHATSVKNKLEILKQTDPRIYILWEDMGAFPFAYVPQKVQDFEETVDFTKAIATLRGKDDRFGAVTKGLVCLDWIRFVHQKGPYVMGEATPEFIRRRFDTKREIWKYTCAYWMQNLSYAKKAIAALLEENPESFLVGLVEDALIEEALPLPVALYGQLLWDPHVDEGKLLTQCALREDVYSL